MENAFGILASRWRAYLGITTGQSELPEEMIKAAVCFHNFLMCGRAYCPNRYCDNVCGETVTEGSWMETVTACAIGASHSCPSPSIALKDEIGGYRMKVLFLGDFENLFYFASTLVTFPCELLLAYIVLQFPLPNCSYSLTLLHKRQQAPQLICCCNIVFAFPLYKN